MHRSSRTHARLFVSLLAFMLGLIQALAWSPLPPSGTRQVKVKDPVLAGRLRAQIGTRLVADYGSFQILEINEASLSTMTDRPGVEPYRGSGFIQLNAGWIQTGLPQARNQLLSTP